MQSCPLVWGEACLCRAYRKAECRLQPAMHPPLRKPGLVHHIGIGQSMGCMLDFSKPLIGIHHDHDETSKHTHDHICRCDVTSKSRLQLILSFHIRGTTFLRITRGNHPFSGIKPLADSSKPAWGRQAGQFLLEAISVCGVRCLHSSLPWFSPLV